MPKLIGFQIARGTAKHQLGREDLLHRLQDLVLAERQQLAKQVELERAAEILAEEYDGRARLSLVGPMALYDFVPEQ